MASGLPRSEAISLAERLAFAFEEASEDVQLLVQDYSGELHARYSG